MITNVLLQHPWLCPAALAAFVLVGPLVGGRLAAHPRVAGGLALLSLVPVAFLTLVPVDRAIASGCAVQWSWPTPGRVELFANLVLFVAPALLATVATRRPLSVLVGGSALSMGIEWVQMVTPSIGRSCDTTDWSSNTLGVAVGILIGLVALLLARTPGSDRPQPRSAEASMSRRVTA